MVASSAQQKQIDSINNLIVVTANDSLKEKKLKEIVLHYQNRNPILHLHYTNVLYAEAFKEKKGDDYGNALLELSYYHRNKGEIDSSLVYVKKAMSVFKDTKNEHLVYFTKNELAQVLQDQRDFVNAAKNYKEVINYFEKKGGKENILQALTTKMNLGTSYNSIRDYESSEKIFMELYNHPYVKEDNERLSSVCINLITVKRRMFDYAAAVKFGEEALAIEKRPKSLSNLYSSLASVYGSLNDFEKADLYYKKSLEINKRLGRVRSINNNLHNIGYNLMKWGKYDEAEAAFLKSNKLFKESGNLTSLRSSYQALAEVNYAKENYKESINYFVKEGAIGDSIFGISKQKAISELEIKYETEKVKREKQEAEAQTALVKEKNKRQTNLLFGLVLIACLILLSSLLFFSRMKNKKKADLAILELKEAQKRLALEKQYRDSELKALKAQMNPHFIFNALNSIQEYIILNKKNLAGDYLGKFADLMRKYLKHSDAGTLTIQDEIESLEMYLDLESLRFEDTLEYSFNVSETINRDQLRIPTMLIQPYIENALKHGLLHRKTGRKLWVTFTKVNDKTITCCIEDNGVGRERAAAIKAQRHNTHESFATKATENRLDLLNYEKKRKIGVKTIDLFDEEGNAKGTRVILNIPTTTN
ncbi:possible sensor protein [unidentified eubacterium SCB49]|nr:possible sensor protein [unidentified eubacterium SCB49]